MPCAKRSSIASTCRSAPGSVVSRTRSSGSAISAISTILCSPARWAASRWGSGLPGCHTSVAGSPLRSTISPAIARREGRNGGQSTTALKRRCNNNEGGGDAKIGLCRDQHYSRHAVSYVHDHLHRSCKHLDGSRRIPRRAQVLGDGLRQDFRCVRLYLCDVSNRRGLDRRPLRAAPDPWDLW